MTKNKTDLKEIIQNTKILLKLLEKLKKPTTERSEKQAITQSIYDVIIQDLHLLERMNELQILDLDSYRTKSLVSLAKTRTALLISAAEREGGGFW